MDVGTLAATKGCSSQWDGMWSTKEPCLASLSTSSLLQMLLYMGSNFLYCAILWWMLDVRDHFCGKEFYHGGFVCRDIIVCEVGIEIFSICCTRLESKDNMSISWWGHIEQFYLMGIHTEPPQLITSCTQFIMLCLRLMSLQKINVPDFCCGIPH